MRARLLRMVPVLITIGVVAFLLSFKLLALLAPKLDVFESQEMLSYDWRVRLRAHFYPQVPPYIAGLFVDEISLQEFNKPENGGFIYPLPRFLYGQAIEELSAQGAKAVGFDIFFLDRNYERDTLVHKDSAGEELPSDAYFAKALREFGKATLAAPPKPGPNRLFTHLLPIDLLSTNAAHVAITSLQIDRDGVRRRCRPFVDDPEAKRRLWNMGIVLAAAQLNLDLDKAEVRNNRLILPGKGQLQREIPLEQDGSFYVNWSVPVDALPPEQQLNLFYIWKDYVARKEGHGGSTQFQDKLVVVMGAGAGNNVSDLGATPLENETLLGSSIWNIAASVTEAKFVHRSSALLEFVLTALMASLSGVLTVRLRASWASAAVLLTAVLYTGLAAILYVVSLYWLPVVLPVLGALLMTYVCLLVYRMVIELVERRRLRLLREAYGQRYPHEVVEMLVGKERPGEAIKFLGLPPSVVRLLLHRDVGAAHGGVRRQVSIFFADIRNFTGFMDESQSAAEAYVQEHGLKGQDADHYMDMATRDILGTVNLYLSTIAEVVQSHGGTLDKYVGDAVMAFWGAPIPDQRHAVAAVQAAIAAQGSIMLLNERRTEENRKKAAAPPDRTGKRASPLPVLTVGTAINSGEAIVGFMGSASLMSNYTVFGAEVNLASRLEGVASSGRIVISESTYRDLRAFEPTLAGSCIAMEPVSLRGISKPVRIYELPVAGSHDHPGALAIEMA